jgi:hypothetical protein
MMAITTSSSIKVNPRRGAELTARAPARREKRRSIKHPLKWKNEKQIVSAFQGTLMPVQVLTDPGSGEENFALRIFENLTGGLLRLHVRKMKSSSRPLPLDFQIRFIQNRYRNKAICTDIIFLWQASRITLRIQTILPDDADRF